MPVTKRAAFVVPLLVVVAVLGAACTRVAATPDLAASPTPAASPSALVNGASSAPAVPSAGVAPASSLSAPPAARNFAAWTDPAATSALVQSCHAKTPRDGPLQEGERDALLCRLPWSQSCVYDPCFQRFQQCRVGCGQTCDSCDEGCAKTCDDCKVSCKDDGCRLACATKTGACKQACLVAIDHCSSAECAHIGKTCQSEEAQKWKSHGCSCAKIRPCTEKCVANAGKCTGDEDCFARCRDRCTARFPGCDVWYCVMGSEPGSTN